MYGSLSTVAKDPTIPFPASPFGRRKEESELYREQQTSYGLLSYRSAPSSLLGEFCDYSQPARESFFARFLAVDDLACKIRQNPAAVNGQRSLQLTPPAIEAMENGGLISPLKEDNGVRLMKDFATSFTGQTSFSTRITQSDAQNEEPSSHAVLGLSHQFSLPKTLSEMAEVQKFFKFQVTAPSNIRAKRGCATHPRSIAERVRRMRISDRIRKLQKLVPNMTKQTNTSEMLDLAVDHIKDLQRQVKSLTESRSSCTCSTRKRRLS